MSVQYTRVDKNLCFYLGGGGGGFKSKLKSLPYRASLAISGEERKEQQIQHGSCETGVIQIID